MTVAKQTRGTNIRPSTGRPTREQAVLRQGELLAGAFDIFLKRGFEQTTMEEIATSVGMSKRTVYARFDDKSALFRAAVLQAIERYTVPIETLQQADTGDLEGTLTAVARIRIVNIMTPVAIQLQRILSTQSYRFPELFNAAFEQGTGPTIRFLTDILQRHRASGEIDIEDLPHAASAFLSLAVGGPARIIVSGNTITDTEIETRINFAVRLFLNGVRTR